LTGAPAPAPIGEPLGVGLAVVNSGVFAGGGEED